MSVYKAEYIWLDGTQPTAQLRSKTKIVPTGEKPPVWGFDGSSTNQAEGHSSDRVLNPVFICPDPIRGGDSKLVMCEVLNVDSTPHSSNTRAALAAVAKKYTAASPGCRSPSRRIGARQLARFSESRSRRSSAPRAIPPRG